jgi:hypothetical protein
MVYCSCVKNNNTIRINDQDSCKECELQCLKSDLGTSVCFDDMYDNSKYIKIVYIIFIVWLVFMFLVFLGIYVSKRNGRSLCGSQRVQR